MIETAASKSFTSARALPARRRLLPLAWLNLLCLDAPLVAVTWQLLFANTFGIAVAHGGTLALFLTAWLIYLADRFGDSLSLGRDGSMSLRQLFCLRHRRAWMMAIALVALADLAVVARQLDTGAIMVGGAIGAAAFVYLMINRLAPAIWCVLPLKEVSIGFIFAAGTMVGLLRSLTNAAWPGWLLFALLCSLNCISIAVWERELDAVQERISIATKFPGVHRALLPALGFVCLTSLALTVSHGSRSLFLCVAGSALLLGSLHVFRGKIQSDVRTGLADLVLLTPIIALLYYR